MEQPSLIQPLQLAKSNFLATLDAGMESVRDCRGPLRLIRPVLIFYIRTLDTEN